MCQDRSHKGDLACTAESGQIGWQLLHDGGRESQRAHHLFGVLSTHSRHLLERGGLDLYAGKDGGCREAHLRLPLRKRCLHCRRLVAFQAWQVHTPLSSLGSLAISTVAAVTLWRCYVLAMLVFKHEGCTKSRADEGW